MAASVVVMTWSRSSGSTPGGSWSCAARAAATATGSATHPEAGGSAGWTRAAGSPVHSQVAAASKVAVSARSIASRPRKYARSGPSRVTADSITSSDVAPGR